MTDSNTSNAIDNMVAALADAGADLSSPAKQGHAGVIYNSADDSFTQTSSAPATGLTPEPLLDDGRDLQASADAIGAEYNALVSRLNAGRFDPTTGEKVYDVTGRQREVLQMQINQLKVSADYSFGRLNAIAHQRVQSGQSIDASVQTMIQLADGKTVTLAEAAAREAYISSAPSGQRVAYGQEYDRLMQEARTRSVTTAVAGTRKR
jgi:hypothetical protein